MQLRVTLRRVSSEAPPVREREERDRRRIERILPELVKKLLDVGIEKLADGPESLRSLLSDARLPKEALSLVVSQFDEIRKDIVRVLSRELRDFLEHASLSEEIARLLSGLTLEVKTQIRFVPNSANLGHLHPEIQTKVGVQVDSAETADESQQSREMNSPNPEPKRQNLSSTAPERAERGRTGDI